MRQIQDQQYIQFTPKERLNLTMAALSRGDETEANRLWQTCPRYKYTAYDFEYTLSVTSAMMLGSLFFQKCILHYNNIKRADTIIIGNEQDLEFEEEKKLHDLANQTKNLINRVKKTQNKLISKLKGLFAGFKQFCSVVEFDYEYILQTIPLKECCHDLDILLATNNEPDTQYANQIQNYFQDLWHF